MPWKFCRRCKILTELTGKRDGASRLAWEFLYCDSINIFLGQAINPAHLNPNLPQEMGFKSRSVQTIAIIAQRKRQRSDSGNTLIMMKTE